MERFKELRVNFSEYIVILLELPAFALNQKYNLDRGSIWTQASTLLTVYVWCTIVRVCLCQGEMAMADWWSSNQKSGCHLSHDVNLQIVGAHLVIIILC